MLRTIVITERERGLVYSNGRLVRWLEPGKHRFLSIGRNLEIHRVDIDHGFMAMTPELRRVLPAGAGEEVFVDQDELGLVTVDGLPRAVLVPGRYVLWQQRAEVAVSLRSTRTVIGDIPEIFWPLVPADHFEGIHVHSWERVLLYVDSRLAQVLSQGAYGVHKLGRMVETVRVDLRERELQITGQEVMSADKVSLRINVIVKVAVVDAARSVEAVNGLDSAIYSEAQMVARRWVGGLTVDQLLEQRAVVPDAMRAELAERAGQWGVEVRKLDLKDIVLPGEMKALLNRVIEAEKQAAANLILRREETAATRSLANTARLLEASPTLLRLKELEAWRDMAQSIDQLTIVAAPQDLVSGLRLGGGVAIPGGKPNQE